MSAPVDSLRARVDVLACLLRARERLRQKWSRGSGPYFAQRHSGFPAYEGWTLLDALAPEEGCADWAAEQLSAWHTRFVLAKVTGEADLAKWNSHPFRTRREVLGVVEQAIRLYRADIVPEGRGWRISTRPALPPIRGPRPRLAARDARSPSPRRSK